MRFAHVTTFYPPFSFGGDGIVVQRIARALASRGHAVTVIHDVDTFELLGGRAGEAPSESKADGVHVVPLKSGLGALSSLVTHQTGRPLVMRRRLRELLDRGGFDVVHFHNVSLVGGPGILGYGGDALRLYTAHEHWLVCPTHVLWRNKREACDGRACLRCTLTYRRPPQLYRYTGFMERMFRAVDVFIAQSEFSRRKHREFGFDRPMELLPLFLPDRTPALRQTTDPPYVFFAGRLEKIKGLDDVIPAFVEDSPIDLWIAGEGTHGSRLRELARGSTRVRFLGRVPSDDIHDLMSGAQAVLVPSVGFETFGSTVIEAFRAGVPVIARRLGPLPELVEHAGGGMLFDCTEELVAILKSLHGDPDLRGRLGDAGREAFLSTWTEEVVLPDYLAIIDRARMDRTKISGEPN